MIQGQLPEKDLRDKAIKETLTHCAAFLGDEFQQFMPMLLEQLVIDTQLPLEFNMQSIHEPRSDDKTSLRVKVKGFGEQEVSMNTHNLERKIGAFTILAHISDRTGKHFAPYVEPLLPVVLEYIAEQHSREIRTQSYTILKNILVATGESANLEIFQKALPITLKELETALGRQDSKTTEILVHGLTNCLRALSRENATNRQFLDEKQIAELGPVIKQSLELVQQLK